MQLSKLKGVSDQGPSRGWRKSGRLIPAWGRAVGESGELRGGGGGKHTINNNKKVTCIFPSTRLASPCPPTTGSSLALLACRAACTPVLPTNTPFFLPVPLACLPAFRLASPLPPCPSSSLPSHSSCSFLSLFPSFLLCFPFPPVLPPLPSSHPPIYPHFHSSAFPSCPPASHPRVIPFQVACVFPGSLLPPFSAVTSRSPSLLPFLSTYPASFSRSQVSSSSLLSLPATFHSSPFSSLPKPYSALTYFEKTGQPVTDLSSVRLFSAYFSSSYYPSSLLVWCSTMTKILERSRSSFHL